MINDLNQDNHYYNGDMTRTSKMSMEEYIIKSKTPKYTLDWYIKWVASCFLMVGMSVRGIEGYQMYDLVLSTCGVSLWLWVSILWNDRALMVLNGVGLAFLLRTLFGSIL